MPISRTDLHMASKNTYLNYILDQLSLAEDITSRAMMGEYVIYCRGKVIGGIYDDRFLVKPTAAAKRLLPDAAEEIPYPGAKPMLLVGDPDNRELLCELAESIAAELPEPKPRRPRKKQEDIK